MWGQRPKGLSGWGDVDGPERSSEALGVGVRIKWMHGGQIGGGRQELKTGNAGSDWAHSGRCSCGSGGRGARVERIVVRSRRSCNRLGNDRLVVARLTLMGDLLRDFVGSIVVLRK
jgi:hypothetical protein